LGPPSLLVECAEIPDLSGLKAAFPDLYPALLSSSAPGGRDGRYDLLLATDGRALVQSEQLIALGGASTHGDFLQSLRAWRASEPAASGLGPPFRGGWLVYLGYEMARYFEPKLVLPQAVDGLPEALAIRTPAAIIVDRLRQRSWLTAEAGAADLLERMRDTLSAELPQVGSDPVHCTQLREDPPQRYTDSVSRVIDYLHAGDVFQVNLSRGWSLRTRAGPQALYQALMAANPAPFSGWLSWAGVDLLSSSPERLVSVRGGRVQTRPIAGTRPRSSNVAEDQRLLDELRSDPKEQAEHVMLIDLERNDLGRVCVPGSVEVDEFCVIESYAHVHHIVSNVQGRLAAGFDALDALAAVFPGGTITGCPKVRCMEIIAELEGTGRGAYTGALGYLGGDGSLDMNILIRTMVLDGSRLSFRTGGGVVADSDPLRELEETRAKARGLLRALEIAS